MSVDDLVEPGELVERHLHRVLQRRADHHGQQITLDPVEGDIPDLGLHEQLLIRLLEGRVHHDPINMSD